MAAPSKIAGPPRLLRAVPPLPAATMLKPALLLSLQAFDAAVRLGSFRAAADALHLTPSAVSHRISNLERMLGDGLFTRGHRAVQPTPTGRALAAATGRAFAELVRATAPVTSEGRQRLRVAVQPLFASAWLIPRIPRFMAAHPDIELVLVNSIRPHDLENEPSDAGIDVGDGHWRGLDAAHLMAIRATPIATAAMVKRLRLRRPADLIRAPLIHVTSFPGAWPLWLRHAGVGAVRSRQAIWVDSFSAALQAAEQGAGLALGLEPLFAERERAGAVCRPFAFSHPTGDYWLVHRPADERRPVLRRFKRWLLAELGESRREPA
jgi:DNA-binding transcriptional LysR family regulator